MTGRLAKLLSCLAARLSASRAARGVVLVLRVGVVERLEIHDMARVINEPSAGAVRFVVVQKDSSILARRTDAGPGVVFLGESLLRWTQLMLMCCRLLHRQRIG